MDSELEIISDQNIFPCGCQIRCICKKKSGRKPLPFELKKPKILTEEEQERQRERHRKARLNFYYRNKDAIAKYKHDFYLQSKNINIYVDDSKQGQQSIMEFTFNPIKLKIIKPKMSDNQINKQQVILITTNKNENTNILTKVN